jgi:cathepsin L
LAGSVGVYQEYQQGYTAYGGTNGKCGVASGAPVAHITGFVKLAENNYTALMNAVATVGPIAVSVDASWGGYSSGIFSGCDTSDNVDINHAVVLVGYGEENGQLYWTIRNSWNANWGENGYIRLARSASDDTNCGTDSTPHVCSLNVFQFAFC